MPKSAKQFQKAHACQFPPFPSPPSGTVITPFKDFVERGIQIHIFGKNEDDQEVDGLGIPTVELPKKHETDRPKSGGKPRSYTMPVVQEAKKKKEEKAEQSFKLPVKRRDWTEDWVEQDRLRGRIAYDPNITLPDRVHAATTDFNKNRRWPPMTTGVRALWDQFQIYAGLLTSIPVWVKQRDSDSADDTFSSDEEEPFQSRTRDIHVNQYCDPEPDAYGDLRGHGGRGRVKRRGVPRAPYGRSGKELGRRPKEVTSDTEIQGLLHDARNEKDDILIDFLNDFAGSIQVFLSGYIRKQGLHFSDRNLHNAPKLISIWLTYLTKHRVFTEPDELAALETAKGVVRKAQEELILTSKLAKALPDDLNSGFKTCFDVGQTKEEFTWADSEMKDADTGEKEKEKRAHSTDEDDESAEPKKIKFTTEDGEVELVEDTSISINDNGGWGDVGLDSNSGWGNVDPDAGGWGNPDPWADELAAAGSLDQWQVKQPSLLPHLGPTTLPLTHDTGIVEWSVRRVVSITPPTGVTLGNLTLEADLAARFYQIELAPWLQWGDDALEPQGVLPRILGASKGKVVIEKQGEVLVEGDVKETMSVVKKDQQGAHNPLTDNIVIFIQESVAEHLRVGMGLGGTWVQLVRNEGTCDKRKNKQAEGKKFWYMDPAAKFWYMESLLVTLTSYHISG
ncbi:hypothetical protein VNI00_010776 [Paramarasmius palmivorus]|uniref:Uncharacterized protein n=1 Tax=Paramarasmius palmivorus TaxID=297713 RepID=A0AAW0CF24_9AGAR